MKRKITETLSLYNTNSITNAHAPLPCSTAIRIREIHTATNKNRYLNPFLDFYTYFFKISLTTVVTYLLK